MDEDPEIPADSPPFAVSSSWGSAGEQVGPAPSPSPSPPPGRWSWGKTLAVGSAAVVLVGGAFGVAWAVASGTGSSVPASSASASQAASGGGPAFSAANPGQAPPGPGPGGPGGFGPRFGGPLGAGGANGNGQNSHKPTPAMAGTVTGTGSTITIQDFWGFTRTIHTTGSTTYARGGQPATSSAVTKGAHITATGTVDKDGTDLDASKVSVQLPSVAGTVQSVSGQSFVIQGRGGATHTVTTTGSTVFRQGRSQGSLSDVKQGSRVVATGDQQSNGNLTATAVQVQPARSGTPPQGGPNAPAPPGPQGGASQSGSAT